MRPWKLILSVSLDGFHYNYPIVSTYLINHLSKKVVFKVVVGSGILTLD